MLLPLSQDVVRELREQKVIKFRIGRYKPLGSSFLSHVLFGPFRAVLGSALLSVLHSLRIESSTNNVVPNAGQVFHSSSPDEHNRMLLQVMAFSRNVGGHFKTVCEPHARYLSQR